MRLLQRTGTLGLQMCSPTILIYSQNPYSSAYGNTRIILFKYALIVLLMINIDSGLWHEWQNTIT